MKALDPVICTQVLKQHILEMSPQLLLLLQLGPLFHVDVLDLIDPYLLYL